MPSMGRPDSQQVNRYNNVKMDPVNRRAPNDNEKERLLNKLTGYRPDAGKFVDEKTHNKMGKDEFLKLLTHQLTNQDPVKPMDQKDMASQLAQFSQLEQLTNLNTKFDGMNGNKVVESKFYGASFLGKEVMTTGSSLELGDNGEGANVLYKLPKDAQRVLVRVFDKQNAMMSEVWKENIGKGNQNLTWDGISLDGTTATPGNYRVQVMAWDSNSDPIKVSTKSKGIVEAVNFENGEAILTVDGKKVFLRDVDSFGMPNKLKASKENASVQNLPLDRILKSEVNLNKNKESQISNGITSVYDVE